MSETKVHPKVKLMIAARAAGHCQLRGCHSRLDVHHLTNTSGGYGHFAHIIADSPDGPRGDPVLSPKLAEDPDNLMLLCFNCHRLIDQDDVAGHPVELLRTYKREHEERVARLMDITADHRVRVLIVKCNIGTRFASISPKDAHRTILPRYPLDRDWEIDLTRGQFDDTNPDDLAWAAEQIRRQLRRLMQPVSSEPPTTDIEVFALLPIPLLMVLGTELGDIASVKVRQKLQEPDTWLWQKHKPTNTEPFAINEPVAPLPSEQEPTTVALVLSISGTVHESEVERTLGSSACTWVIVASEPGRDFVRSLETLRKFGVVYRKCLARIRERHGPSARIHLFPAVPNSIAVECGRLLRPKADPAITVYDLQGPNGFVRALDIPSIASPGSLEGSHN